MSKIARISLTLFLLALGGSIYLNFTSLHTEEQPFDSTLWNDLNNESMLNDPGCVRGGMALSLIRSERLTGIQKSEVVALLGEVETSTTPTELRYGLGQCHWDWKHSSMVVTFNTAGLVTLTSIELEKPANDKH